MYTWGGVSGKSGSACYWKGDLVWCRGLSSDDVDAVFVLLELSSPPPMESTIAFSSSHTAVNCIAGEKMSRSLLMAERRVGAKPSIKFPPPPPPQGNLFPLPYKLKTVVTPRVYAQAGLSNQFCPSVVVIVCHKFFWKTLLMGDLEATTISKLEDNA